MAVPSFAQSFDPDVGSGNIVPPVANQSGANALHKRLTITKEEKGDMSARRRLAGYIIPRIDLSAIRKGSIKTVPTTSLLADQRRPRTGAFLLFTISVEHGFQSRRDQTADDPQGWRCPLYAGRNDSCGEERRQRRREGARHVRPRKREAGRHIREVTDTYRV